MIAFDKLPQPGDTLTLRDLCELIQAYVEKGLSIDTPVDVVLFGPDHNDPEATYPATMLACHLEKSEVYLYAERVETENSDDFDS